MMKFYSGLLQGAIHEDPTPRWRSELRWWLKTNGLKMQRRRIQQFWQRGHKGYSTVDVWGLDSYLIDIIEGSVKELHGMAHGHPGELTMAQWEDILCRICAGMAAGRQLIDLEYITDDGVIDHDFELALKVEFDEAMDLLKAWFFGLWD